MEMVRKGIAHFLLLVMLMAGYLCSIEAIIIREGTYLPARESDRGKNLKKLRSFSSHVRHMRKQHGSVKFVLGFSTGHVGTTTFSSPSAYVATNSSRDIHFVFEKGGVPPSTCAQDDWDFKKEIVHSEYYYLPELMRGISLSRNSTVVDLSHANICFYRGLVNVLHSNRIPFTFVRIRRDRIETALSMSIQDESRVDFFKRDYYRFHPFEGVSLVHLRIPGGEATWANFSMTQKLLWVIDETQARWESLIAKHPDLPRAQVMWSKEKENIRDGIKVVGGLLGLRPIAVPPMTKVHAGDKSESEKLRKAVLAQDLLYRKKMGFNSTAPELENFDTDHSKRMHNKRKYILTEHSGSYNSSSRNVTMPGQRTSSTSPKEGGGGGHRSNRRDMI